MRCRREGCKGAGPQETRTRGGRNARPPARTAIEGLERRQFLAATPAPVPTPTASPTPVPQPAIIRLAVVQVRTNATPAVLTDGATLDLSKLGDINLRADTATGSTASVIFKLDGKLVRVENTAPFAVAGDDGKGHYNRWTLTNGRHTLTATPCGAANGSGTPGKIVLARFTV